MSDAGSPVWSYQELALAAIDLTDRSFVVSYGFELDSLVDSIRQVGLLYPPLVRLQANGRGQVVCGLKRLLALDRLGRKRISVRVWPKTTSPAVCLLAALHDNVWSRGFNLVERGEMINRLLRYWDRDTVTRKFLPRLNVPPAAKYLEQYQQLVSLEEPFRELAAQDRLGLGVASSLSHWTAVDRLALLPWLALAPLSYSKQVEMVEHLNTLSRREGLSPQAILSRPAISGLLADPGLRPAEKISRVREQLRQWCFPRFSAAQQQFDTYLKALGLYQQSDLRLQPSPAFEGNTFSLELQFDHPQHLAERLRQLLELTEREEFQALTRL